MAVIYHEYNAKYDVYPHWQKPTPKFSFIICTTPRSGSSLLCLTLMGIGRFGVPAEYFDETNQESLKISWNVSDGKSYVRELIARRTTASGVFGMKLHWHNLIRFYKQNICQFPGVMSNNTLGTLNNMLGRYFNEVKYIFLTRKDKARQAVSFWLAAQTGQWRRYKGDELPPVEHVKYDYNSIKGMYSNVLEQENNWKNFFDFNKIYPLVVEYEYMLTSFDECVNDVMTYISGDTFAKWAFPGIEPQNYEISNQLVEKFKADLAQVGNPG